MLKRISALLLAVAFIALTVAPDALACDRRRNRVSSNYNSYRYRGVASDRYYYNGGSYNRGGYYNGGNYYRGRNGVGQTGRAVLTVAAPAALGAGVGAILNGKKGAAIGALLGGGGGAAYYLLKHRGRR